MSEITVHHGDSREVLKGIADASIDACVCDPPYALVSIGKRFGKPGSAAAKSEGASGVYARASAGFMGQQWDTGETAFAVQFWAEVFRVLKPGAHVVAFSGTRTYHRLACAIEDAGFEIRDMVAWMYGSGFPKSHNVSKGIDKAADYRLLAQVRRAAVAAVEDAGLQLPGNSRHDWTSGEHAPGDKWWAAFQAWLPKLCDTDRARIEGEIVATVRKAAGWFTSGNIYELRAPATESASEWQGWGTALKPALEPIVFARKPLQGTVAANVLQHGTGALNIDASRVDASGRPAREIDPKQTENLVYSGRVSGGEGLKGGSKATGTADLGRWPANVVHDGSEEVVAAFPAEAGAFAPVRGTEPSNAITNVYGARERVATHHHADRGSAARFFYTAKADAEDRLGSKHPTVKPVDLMAWLCRLVTPPGGLILDPFAGTGTTGIAAMREGFDCILIEREEKFVADIRRRLAWVKGEGRLTAQEMSRAEPKPVEDLPLFGGEAA